MSVSYEIERVCIVTGAASGLGAAIATGLAAVGARVVMVDINADALEDTASHLRQVHGEGQVVTAVADTSDESRVQGVADIAVTAFGRIDVLVNNAGTGPQLVRPDYITNPLMSWDVPPKKWCRIMEINAIGPFLLARAVIPGMLERGWGRIVNVSTTWETMLRPGFAAYGPSKAAVEAMTVGMAAELEGRGVTVNTIHPGGPVDTAQVPQDIGVDRATLLRPEVMVEPIKWLITSEAAAHVTARRITAAYWRADTEDDANLAEAVEPAAWPQLVRDIVMGDRGNLS